MLCRDRCQGFTKYRVLLGAIFTVSPIGIPWYYGNLATYNESYFRFTANPEFDDADTTWMLSSFFIGLCLGQVVSGTIADKAGLIKTFLVSNIIFDVGVFMTYFSVQHSVLVTLFTLMVIPGFCSGVVLALSFSVVAAWFRGGKRLGVATSFVSVAFSAGALVYNEMCTAYINPENLTPDYIEGNMVFFSQPEIIDRYPTVFFLIGLLSIIFQIIGMPLLKTPPPAVAGNIGGMNSELEKKNEMRNYFDKENSTHNHNPNGKMNGNDDVGIINGINTIPLQDLPYAVESDLKLQQINDGYDNTFGDDLKSIKTTDIHIDGNNQNIMKPKQNDGYYNTFENVGDVKTDTPSEHHRDIKPLDVVRTSLFHALWFASFSQALGYLVVNNYYKLFGQVWINSDSFLATIGSISTISGAITRVFSGIAVDKIGLKNTTIAFCAFYTFFMSFWYLSVRPNRYFYMVFTNVLSGILSCIFIIFPLGALEYFGHRYYPTNYGLLMMSTLFANVLAPLIFPLLITHFGWFGLFISTSMLGPIIIVVMVICMP